jgi:hypothetical protein
MLEEKQTFLCSSAEWNQIVEIEEPCSFEEIAAVALKRQIDCDENLFSVGAVISVTPIKINEEDTKLIYSPSVLADIGMHQHAKEMINQIDKDETKD